VKEGCVPDRNVKTILLMGIEMHISKLWKREISPIK
jgi:hypothetical protein